MWYNQIEVVDYASDWYGKKNTGGKQLHFPPRLKVFQLLHSLCLKAKAFACYCSDIWNYKESVIGSIENKAMRLCDSYMENIRCWSSLPTDTNAVA